MTNFNFTPIGYISSCYKDKFGTPRQPSLAKSSHAFLEIDKKWNPIDSLSGIEGFSYVWLIWVFHQNTNTRFHAKVHPPRAEGKSLGVFATRSPHHPNPIGLSLVKLEKVEEGVLSFSGIDLVDGTPILDIKPYIPDIESKPEAKSGWVEKVKLKEIKIVFSDDVEEVLILWQKSFPMVNIKDLIIETIQLDPRPLVYRGFEGQSNSPYREEHVFRLMNGDVHFRFLDENSAKVFLIKLLE